MEIWQTLQEELNRLYEMFVQRNPYFEANGGKVSIVAHSLGCVVTYDILTGWTQVHTQKSSLNGKCIFWVIQNLFKEDTKKSLSDMWKIS